MPVIYSGIERECNWHEVQACQTTVELVRYGLVLRHAKTRCVSGVPDRVVIGKAEASTHMDGKHARIMSFADNEWSEDGASKEKGIRAEIVSDALRG